ncbi:Na+/H+ antiporter subunit E [Agrobacterium sp.]|uniref:Na+/H+ antiporter subunit E n=1 Tax=Agrobacterium sp. TaxID=361 RepID=UPI0028A71EA9|nr:Na+/H+ antiporter subunit E [Agrobacterium sp.]
MTLLIVNVLFVVVWVAITGSATILNIAFGFLLSAFALWLIRDQVGGRIYWIRIGRIASLVCLFFKELMLSAWNVAVMVVKPRMNVQPGIFAFPLTVTSDFQITLLANLITLTPGTLSVDVSDDRRFLYVHAVDCTDIEATKHDIANGFERKIMEAFQ